MAVWPPGESQDRGSPPAPTRPTRQKGLCGRGYLGTDLARQGCEKGKGTHLGGLRRLRANKGEPGAEAAGHPSPSERSPRAFRASEEDARRGGLRTRGRSPEQRGGAGGRFRPEVGDGCSERAAAPRPAALEAPAAAADRASEVFSPRQLAAGGGSAALRQLIMLLLCAGWVSGGRADRKAQPLPESGAPHWLKGEYFQEPHQGQKRK